jgi:hypothetical protein
MAATRPSTSGAKGAERGEVEVPVTVGTSTMSALSAFTTPTGTRFCALARVSGSSNRLKPEEQVRARDRPAGLAPRSDGGQAHGSRGSPASSGGAEQATAR